MSQLLMLIKNKHAIQDAPNSNNCKDLSYHSFEDMLSMGRKSKKNYEYLPLSIKRKGIMYDKKTKICQLIGKERKKIFIKSKKFE